MQTKVYASSSIISFNVVVEGVRKHIHFQSNGSGSILVTSDEKLQDVLESNSLFNRRYYLREQREYAPQVFVEEEDEDKTKIVKVTDIEEARDYLSEHFGVGKSTLRSKAKIIAAAKIHNIEFDGI